MIKLAVTDAQDAPLKQALLTGNRAAEFVSGAAQDARSHDLVIGKVDRVLGEHGQELRHLVEHAQGSRVESDHTIEEILEREFSTATTEAGDPNYRALEALKVSVKV